MRADYVSVDESMVSYIFYIIKQDFRICVPYSRPNGWTEWAEIFCRQSCFFSSTGNVQLFSQCLILLQGREGRHITLFFTNEVTIHNFFHLITSEVIIHHFFRPITPFFVPHCLHSFLKHFTRALLCIILVIQQIKTNCSASY